jgi:hypothetical protein
LRSANFRTLYPDGHVLLDNGGHEVVQSRFPLSWKRLSVSEVLSAKVRIVTHGKRIGPRPNIAKT